MVACLLLLLTLLPLSWAQPGFVSIRSCATSNTKDRSTNITWTSDNYLFNNVGRCKTVSFPSANTLFYRNARVFGRDHRTRWCCNLPVVRGQDYLVRATFLYGPSLRSMPETYFNFSIGSTSISRVNSSLNSLEVEGVFAATDNHTNICLLKGKGNAYISMLELRPLNDTIYLNGGSSIILKLVTRLDLGNKKFGYRYPVDPADRQWSVEENYNKSVVLGSDISLRANSSIPLEVLQNAAVDVEQLEFLHTNLDTNHDDFLIILYFLELNADVQTGQRAFDIYVNGDKKYERVDILENGNVSNYREVSMRVKLNGCLNISLVKVSNATYGPICNAYEIFQVYPRSAETLESNVNAMEELRDELVGENPGDEILRKWLGDPCVPSPWEGLSCEERNGTLVITMLDLSSKNLQGPLPTIISNLTELKELNVQNNDFNGSIPESFASLHHLSKLSIKCNPQLNSQLPPGLLDWTNLTVVSGSCVAQDLSQTQTQTQTQTPQQTIYFIGSVAGGSVAFTIALGMIFTCFYKRAHRRDRRDHQVTKGPSFHDLPMNPVVQSYPLQYIEKATSNYQTLIGEGGFGAVYRGTLPHGEEVAVKVRSATSTQGTREFDNEVNLLSNIRHENLVPLLGYCCENDQQILVYPFMSNGSLQDRLYGEASKRKALDWPTRLSIALGAARGLMYLHTFAGRCIIHRDVKSSNILLDHSMCGKVADFGFSKYAPQEGDSGASLEVRGTAGYLDPEYYSTQQLSTKSDVFSFGVVLLEIITGREPLNIHRPRNEWSLLEWAKPFIRESRIEEIVDPSIKGGYHAEAMWRVVETALACIEPFSTYRPSMVDIVRELEDALIIENNASEYMRSIESIGGSNQFLSVERKMMAPTPTPTEPSPCQIMAVLQPR